MPSLRQDDLIADGRKRRDAFFAQHRPAHFLSRLVLVSRKRKVGALDPADVFQGFRLADRKHGEHEIEVGSLVLHFCILPLVGQGGEDLDHGYELHGVQSAVHQILINGIPAILILLLISVPRLLCPSFLWALGLDGRNAPAPRGFCPLNGLQICLFLVSFCAGDSGGINDKAA